MTTSRIRNLMYLVKVYVPIRLILAHVSSRRKVRKFQVKYQAEVQAFHNEIDDLSFTRNWFSHNIPLWKHFLEPFFRDAGRTTALEIGSWEGMSSYWLLSNFEKVTVTCVDTWIGGDEHRDGAAATSQIVSQAEARFDSNISKYRQRIVKFHGSSLSFFSSCEGQQEVYDFVYIDGSHRAKDVFSDAIHSFELLKPEGLMIFDDYFWRYFIDPRENPAIAINLFLRLKQGQWRLVFFSHQLIIQKLLIR